MIRINRLRLASALPRVAQSRHITASILVSISLAFATAAAIGNEDRGFLGFAVEVDGQGFFLNPTLKSATISSVAEPSPAASAGIAPKDKIIEVEGHVVAGAKGNDIAPLLKKAPGQSIRLKLKRPSGEEYEVTLVAVAKPVKP